MEMFVFCVITFQPVEVKLVSTSKNDMAENWIEKVVKQLFVCRKFWFTVSVMYKMEIK